MHSLRGRSRNAIALIILVAGSIVTPLTVVQAKAIGTNVTALAKSNAENASDTREPDGLPVSQSNQSDSPDASPTKHDTPPSVTTKPIELNTMLAWGIVFLIVSIGLLVAIYPIAFYLRQVWKSRQRAIFETLNAPAKKLYLELYRRSEVGDLSTDANVESEFSKVYNHWFGSGRLLTPTWLIGAILLAYAVLTGISAAQVLIPAPLWAAPFKLPLTALAAITGAYILITMDTIARVVRRDLLPEDLQLTALRLIACVPLGYAFASLAKDDDAPFIALAVTAIPLQQIASWLAQFSGKRLGITDNSTPSSPGADAPSQLSGVDRTVCERFSAIGVNTISQIAYSDPVQLTMRTSLNFVFLLDVVSQALAWVYLDEKLNLLRPMGLRGAFEIAALKREAAAGDANAQAVLAQLPGVLGLTPEQCANVIHQIADDQYTGFVVIAYA